MSKNFDGQRDTRLKPPCICGDMLKYDSKEELWFCDECGLDLETCGSMPYHKVYYDEKYGTLVSVHGRVRTDEAPESPIPVNIYWSLDEFHVRILIDEHGMSKLKSQLGMQKVTSRCWGEVI